MFLGERSESFIYLFISLSGIVFLQVQVKHFDLRDFSTSLIIPYCINKEIVILITRHYFLTTRSARTVLMSRSSENQILTSRHDMAWYTPPPKKK